MPNQSTTPRFILEISQGNRKYNAPDYVVVVDIKNIRTKKIVKTLGFFVYNDDDYDNAIETLKNDYPNELFTVGNFAPRFWDEEEPYKGRL